MYQEIEDNKNPHLYSKLSGDNLDDMCHMVNITRRTDESDQTLLYRLNNWTLDNAMGNTTAITDALLDLAYASNVTYVPNVYGCGTAVAYVIPNDYSTDTIANALNEAKERVENVVSPSLYIQYIVPKIIPVSFSIALSVTKDTDIEFVKALLELKIQEYINSIAPKDYMEIGQIEKFCMEEDTVSYFKILSYSVNEEEQSGIRILQQTETKLMFDTISWTEVTV